MNVGRVISELEIRYPGKRVLVNDSENPTEVICEVEPASKNPSRSVAIAVLDATFQHFHRKTTEVYKVIKGTLTINKAGKEYVLKKGDSVKINPLEHHTAEGHETWVEVTSTPAWTSKDHILVK
jgi:mannose-6-phosphate isomerase-like protein (cupin superfamily)